MKAQNSDHTESIGIGISMIAFESIGFAFREQTKKDYGIDAHVEIIESEQATGRLLALQVKSGPSYLSEIYESGYVFRAKKEHVEYWQNHALPVLICLCDIHEHIVYWQIVNEDTAISTGKNYKFMVPNSQQIDQSSIDNLRYLLTPIVATERYTIFNTSDKSHGMAKRYVFNIVLNDSMSKAEVAAIVRQVTNEGKKRRYHRNQMVEGRWGNSDAHVVWTYIYPSAEDCKRDNYVCCSIWIHDTLDSAFRPTEFYGENVGDSIIVDWSDNYDFFAKHVSINVLSKENYFAKVLPQIEKLKLALSVVGDSLIELSDEVINESTFLITTEAERRKIDKLYTEITDLSYAPFECRDMDTKLKSFIDYLHNIWTYYAENNQAKWDAQSRLSQSLRQIPRAKETLQHLEYELSKIR